MKTSLNLAILYAFLLTTPVMGQGPALPGDGPVSSDWPTYMHDNARSGRSPVELTLPLHLVWTHEPMHPPREAWPGTAQSDHWRKRSTPEEPRVVFDKAFQLVGAGDHVYYASSADDQVYCLDLETGRFNWSYFAEGPIRLAPTIAGNRVLFGSDDGRVYALNREDGTLAWKLNPAPDQDTRLPGNGRLISLFPVRSSVLVRDRTGFFAAGLFPSQGAWHCSVNLDTGELMDEAALTVSPQGYLEERDGQLFTPTGRVPAGQFLRELRERDQVDSPEVAAIPETYPYAFISTPSQGVGGGDGVVAVLDTGTGKELWEADVKGKARSLAIVGGRLLVGTDEGMIYAFGSSRPTRPRHHVAALEAPASDPAVSGQARRLVEATGRTRGYALVLGDREGDLTLELARNSDLQVVAAALSEGGRDRQRRRLSAAGLYGRAVVHDVGPGKLPYQPGIFNLVVAFEDGPDEDLTALLCPAGGVLARQGQPMIRREPVTNGGEWTHIYADPGNSASSNDRLAGDRFRLQWFGQPGPQNIVDRHLRPPPPLSRDGFLFVPGNNYLYGMDAYNGTILWEREVPNFRRTGALRDSGSMVAGPKELYAVTANRCLVLDRLSGSQRAELRVPDGSPASEWGYLGLLEDTLVGSAVPPGGVFREMNYQAIYTAAYGDNTEIATSYLLFAHDPGTGRLLWRYRPKGAIFNPSIALNGRHVLFVESCNEKTLKDEDGRQHYPALLTDAGADLVGLDRRTGAVAWRRPLARREGIQTLFLLCTEEHIAIVNSRNMVAEGGTAPTVHYEIEVRDPGGAPRWNERFATGQRPNLDHGEQDRHPALLGNRLVVEPNIYDIATGEFLEKFQRAGGCGTISGSANALYFRASNPAAYSLENKQVTPVSTVSRPGCWINMIPAGGLLLVPEGSSGCICNFAIQASMAFAPAGGWPGT